MPGRCVDERARFRIEDTRKRGCVRAFGIRPHDSIADIEHGIESRQNERDGLHRLTQFAHRHGCIQPVAEHVAHRDDDSSVIEHEGIVPIAADRGLAVPRPIVG